MSLVALVLSLAVVVLGAVGILVPDSFLSISRVFLNPAGLFTAAALRLVLGASLFVSASRCRAPKTLRIVGPVIFVAGLVTPLIGVERARAIVEWWAAQGSVFMRAWASFALVFGLFLVYAVAPPTSRSRHL